MTAIKNLSCIAVKQLVLDEIWQGGRV